MAADASGTPRGGAIWLAAVFVVVSWTIPVAIPLIAAGSRTMSPALRQTGGILFGVGVVIVLAAFLIRVRRPHWSTSERALYWLACVPAVVLGIAAIFSMGPINWFWTPQGRYVLGFNLGALVVVVSAIVLSGVPRVIGRVEFVVYSLGCAVAVTLGMGYWFQAMEWSWWAANPSRYEARNSGMILGTLISALVAVVFFSIRKDGRSP